MSDIGIFTRRRIIAPGESYFSAVGEEEGPPPTFTPADLPNLIIWYKADVDARNDSTGPCSNGEGVNDWLDQSGLGQNIYAGGNPELIYQTAQLNGLPVLTNDGTKSLSTGGIPNSIGFGGTFLSAFCVIKCTGTSGRLISMGPSGVDSGATGWTIYQNGSTAVNTYNAGDVGVHTIPSAAWAQVGTIFGSGSNTMYVNNVAGTPVASSPTFASAVDIGVTVMCNGSANKLTGQIAEVVITKSALNSTERNSLAAYFTAKWGV